MSVSDVLSSVLFTTTEVIVIRRYRQVRQFVREWGWLPSFVLLMYMLIMVHTLVSSLNG